MSQSIIIATIMISSTSIINNMMCRRVKKTQTSLNNEKNIWQYD